MTQKICSNCVLDTTVEDIWFDQDGKCKYCYIHDEMEKIHPLNGSENKNFYAIIDKIKKSGKGKKYDCICGLSGGRDSTYTLLLAVKNGLRPLCVTLDNGWGTTIATKNIENACRILKVDSITVNMDWNEYKDIQRAFLLAGVSDVDLPSDLAIYGLLFSVAKNKKIKYILNGHSFRTEGTSPISWSYFDPIYIKDVYRKFGNNKKLITIPSLSIIQLIKYVLINRIREIRLLEYVNYEKKTVDNILENKLGWEDYGGHHHENIFTYFIQSYYLPKKFDIDKRKTELSAMIRSNQISRSSALEILSNSYEYDQEVIDNVIKRLGFSVKEFDDIMKSRNRTHKDFKTLLKIYNIFKTPLDILTKLHILPRIMYLKYVER